MTDEIRLYGVSRGNGNDGVSHMFPDFYIRTDQPFRAAEATLIGDFKPEFRAKVKDEMIVDGEADYTISAMLLDPVDDRPSYQEIAEAEGFTVYEFDNDGGDLDQDGGTFFLWGKGGVKADPAETYADGGESYESEADAWEGCCEANNLEMPSWSEANGAYRIVEVFPVDEPKEGDAQFPFMADAPIHDSLEDAFEAEVLALVEQETTPEVLAVVEEGQTTDAKVYGMIDDLSRGALAELLDLPPEAEHSHHALTMQVREAYEAGTIRGDVIVDAWEDAEE